MDISKIEGLIDEPIVVDLPRNKQPNHKIHQRPNKRQLQFGQSFKPRSEQVGNRTGQEPEREKIDISPAQIIQIMPEVPPSLRSKKQKKATKMINVLNETVNAFFVYVVKWGYSFPLPRSIEQTSAAAQATRATSAKQQEVLTTMSSSCEKVLIYFWQQKSRTMQDKPSYAVQVMKRQKPTCWHAYRGLLQVRSASRWGVGWEGAAPFQRFVISNIIQTQGTPSSLDQGLPFIIVVSVLFVQKMKNIIELERKTAELTEDIADILHVAHLNLQALIAETRPLHSSLPSEFEYLHTLLGSLQALLGERSHLHMGFLITRQIQEEEERVRRERLVDYEEKIFDQRRIISDKEGFFESLLRPKKKRLPSQTVQEFQQARAREREAEEKQKVENLIRQLAEIQSLKRMLETQERDNILIKKAQERIEKEKNWNVNSTALSVNQQGQFATEKIIAIPQEKISKQKDPVLTHVRSNSLQHSIVRQPIAVKAGPEQVEQNSNITKVIDEIFHFKQENQELHRIYDQQCSVLRFKKGQSSKMKEQYLRYEKKLNQERQTLRQLQKNKEWMYNRSSKPFSTAKRSNSQKNR